MSIHHILGREDTYLITTDHRTGKPKRGQVNGSVTLHSPKVEGRAELSTLAHNFGYGFEVGRNGSESDLGLDLYAGRLGALWLRLRSPWTAWARIGQDKPDWYHARHTGVRFFPWDNCIVEVKVEDVDGVWSKGQPWWRSMKLTTTNIIGRTAVVTTVTGEGSIDVQMPEGHYSATWKREAYTTTHVRFPGTLIDRIRGPRTHATMTLDIPGGIPEEGKGENSWDCGMDGVYSSSGPDVPADVAAANLATSVLKRRARYGGPHNLTRPTTVTEASGVAR